MAIGKVAHINLGLTLIPTPRTSLEQLEENADRSVQTFGACWVEQNEKLAKYFVKKVLGRIMALDEIKNVITKMTENAFRRSYGMISE